MKVLPLLIGANILNYVTVTHFVQVKKKWWAKAGIFLVSFLLTGMIMYIGEWTNFPPTFAAVLLGIYLCCEGSSLKKITFGLLSITVYCTANALFDNYLDISDSDRYWGRFLFAVILFAGIKLFFRSADREEGLSSSMWGLLILLILTPLGIVFSVILLTSRFGWAREALGFLCVLLLIALFAVIGLLWTVQVLMRQKRMEREHMYMEMNQKYYEMMEQQHFEIRRLKHDMANHLQALLGLSEEKRETYIQELIKGHGVSGTLNYCKDPAVNAVLASKEQIFKESKITFRHKIDIQEELPFEKPDICAMFANALDNAAEAIKKEALPEEKRWISLESRFQKGMFVLSVKNPSSVKVTEGKLLDTGKRDRKNHGVGLKSIQEAVKRYQGNMELHTENGIFELFLWIQFPDS